MFEDLKLGGGAVERGLPLGGEDVCGVSGVQARAVHAPHRLIALTHPHQPSTTAHQGEKQPRRRPPSWTSLRTISEKKHLLVVVPGAVSFNRLNRSSPLSKGKCVFGSTVEGVYCLCTSHARDNRNKYTYTHNDTQHTSWIAIDPMSDYYLGQSRMFSHHTAVFR